MSKSLKSELQFNFSTYYCADLPKIPHIIDKLFTVNKQLINRISTAFPQDFPHLTKYERDGQCTTASHEWTISSHSLPYVYGKLMDAGMPEDTARESVDLLGIEVIAFDAELAHHAAILRTGTKKHGLSMGDRSCLALGLSRQNRVITAEKVWGKLNIGVEIELIRQ